MSDSAERETILPPFTAFNFRIELYLQDVMQGGKTANKPDKSKVLCSAAFSDCDGLEMSIEPKTIREGGNNGRQIHLLGPVSYGQLALKRGMTANFDLWDWFDQIYIKGNAGIRAAGYVVMYAADGKTEQVRFLLDGCLPIKLKAPTLSAKDGLLAIEELQVAYESLRMERPS